MLKSEHFAKKRFDASIREKYGEVIRNVETLINFSLANLRKINNIIF